MIVKIEVKFKTKKKQSQVRKDIDKLLSISDYIYTEKVEYLEEIEA